MPTYEYKCGACQHHFEQFQSMKDKALKKCPSCGKARLERLIGTGAAIIFKGSGFYQTDYRSEAYKTAQKADKAESAPAASSSTPSDSAGSGSTSSDADVAAKTGQTPPSKSGPKSSIAPKADKKTSENDAKATTVATKESSRDSGASKSASRSGKDTRTKSKG